MYFLPVTDQVILHRYQIECLKSANSSLANCTITFDSYSCLKIIASTPEEISAIQKTTKKLQRSAQLLMGVMQISIYFNDEIVENYSQFATLGINPAIPETSVTDMNATLEREATGSNAVDVVIKKATAKLSGSTNDAFPVSAIAQHWQTDESSLLQELNRLEVPTLYEKISGTTLITMASFNEAIENGLLNPYIEKYTTSLVTLPFLQPDQSAQPAIAKPSSSPRARKTSAKPSKVAAKKTTAKPAAKSTAKSTASFNGASSTVAPTVGETASALPANLRGFKVASRPKQTIKNLLATLKLTEDSEQAMAVMTDLAENPNSVYAKAIKSRKGDLPGSIRAAKTMIKMNKSAAAD